VSAEQQQRQMNLIWGAMLSAVVLYGVVCAVAVGNTDGDAVGDPVSVRYGFSVVAIVLGGLSVWWRRRFLAADFAPAPFDFARMQAHGVAVWALSEAVGLCGVLTALLVREVREYIPFGAAAMGLLLLHRPSNLPWTRLAPPGS